MPTPSDYASLAPGAKHRKGIFHYIIIALLVAIFGITIGCLVIVRHGEHDIAMVKDGNAELEVEMKSVLGVMEGLAPRKYAVSGTTPRTYQEDRGTCWDFGTLNLLEVSYRKHAIDKGYFKPDTYLKFSQQAYGISMMEECWKHELVCSAVGDMVSLNSTEGGEMGWLYYLTKLYDQVLPHSVCPYPLTSSHDNEWKCDGMKSALQKNPLRFDITEMQTAYNVHDSKLLMLKKRAPLGWSSLVHNVAYHFPCSDDFWKNRDECSEAKKVSCPTDRIYPSTDCAVVVAPCYNMDGEFYSHDAMDVEGGHAMNAVGYNDDFVTHMGDRGGFIIKNSWRDELYPMPRAPRGSHSIAFYMQEISDWDERSLCPNPLNPNNWLSCLAQATGPTMALRGSKNVKGLSGIQYCLDEKLMHDLVDLSYQPAEFECLDESFCSKDSKYRYFFVSGEKPPQEDLLSVTMARYDSTTFNTTVIIKTPMLITQQIALIFKPVKWQLDKLNDNPDICGFYFWPYSVIEKQVGMFGGFYTTHFDTTWDERSFAANAGKYPDFDYSFIHDSTFKQDSKSFNGPYAWLKERF